MHTHEILKKFCPDVLERHELPPWFINMADSRSKGRLEFIVIDRYNEQEFIHADYFIDGEHYETKTFKIKIKK